MNHKIKRNIKILMGVFCTMFVMLIVYLGYSVINNGEQWFLTPYNPRLISAKQTVEVGDIKDRQGEILATNKDGERVYNSDESVREAVSHVVGDSFGKTIGAETFFAKYLYGYDRSAVDKFIDVFQGDDKKGSDISLTIDAELSDAILKAMDGRAGAVAVINYKTGEILASVSSPNFDPEDLKQRSDEEETGSQYVNRVTMGRYPPGSTMKIITAACALENGVDDFTTTCDGSVTINGAVIRCAGDAKHGKVDLEKAFEESCNTYFAQLANELGAAKLTKTAEEFGFNVDFSFDDITLYESKYNAGNSDSDLAWSAVGQFEDLMTPLHGAMIAGAVANDGVMMEPKMLLDVSFNGNVGYTMKPRKYRTVLTQSVASQLQSLMEGVITDGTGSRAAIDGVTVCGKTGTAEYVEDGEKKEHAWFSGYIDSEKHPYSVCVILEGAGSGSKNAAPLAKEALSKAMDIIG